MKKIATWMLSVCLVLSTFSARTVAFDTILNINSPGQDVPDSIGSNTQLNLSGEGVLPYEFEAGNRDGSSTNIEVNISGGTVHSHSDAFSGTIVNLSGGTIETNFNLWSESELRVSGGEIGESLRVRESSSATITGGKIANRAHVLPNAKLNILGGQVGDRLWAVRDGHVELLGGTIGIRAAALEGGSFRIAGGNVGGGFQAYPNSQVEIVGSNFLIDGQRIDGLEVGVPFAIDDRNVVLSGTLLDGSPFKFTLIDILVDYESAPVIDYFDHEARLTVYLVPEPNSSVVAVCIALFFVLSRRIATDSGRIVRFSSFPGSCLGMRCSRGSCLACARGSRGIAS